jgi:hypothetical protein
MMNDLILAYNQAKHDYLNLCLNSQSDNTNQIGGGAWGFTSDGNDHTHDLLSHYNLISYEDDDIIHQTDLKTTTKAFTSMYRDYERDLKKSTSSSKRPTSKNADYHYTSQYQYIGVIIYCIEHSYPIKTTFLKRALIHAYRDYIRLHKIKEASGWRDWKARSKALIREIKLLNYAINTAKAGFSRIEIDSKKSVGRSIDRLLKQNPKLTIDKIHLKYRKVKPTYSFQKYLVQPAIDPNLLNEGSIMTGHEGRKSRDGSKIKVSFIVVSSKNGNRVWKTFDPFDNAHSNATMLDDDIFVRIYDGYHRI